MVSRVESAANTRRALIDAAAELLDLGGPEAVTLREVGARAGVTRGAPYRHFADKGSLLDAVAVESWDRLSDRVLALRTDTGLSASERLRGALRAHIGLGREQPHLYQMLFKPAVPTAEIVRAAGRFQEEFLAIVAALVGERNAGHYGALLLAGAHGITGMALSGHLDTDRWHTTADELADTLVGMVAKAGETPHHKARGGDPAQHA